VSIAIRLNATLLGPERALRLQHILPKVLRPLHTASVVPAVRTPLFPRPETMNDHLAFAYPSTFRASPPSSFARAPCEWRAPISAITGWEQAGRSTGKSATKPMKIHGARQILCIKESSASIRSMQRLFAHRIDLDLVAVQRLCVGLQIAAYERFDALVIDLNFREEDPAEVLRKVRSDPQFASTPVVAISTLPLPGDIWRAREIGFDACLTESTAGTRLLRVLDCLLLRRDACPDIVRRKRNPALHIEWPLLRA
jgi:CheY-like chemotaxis protein